MWYSETGPMGEVIISSRVRLARNIKGYPFVHKMTKEEAIEVIHICKDAILSAGNLVSKSMKYINVMELNDDDKHSLVLRHLMSLQMLNSPVPCGLILSEDEKLSIMINEEDHIRIQSMAAGLNLEMCYDAAQRVDDLFEEKLDFGFDEMLGYLTCCPTNVGTAMRASAMARLNALVRTGAIENVILAISKLGMTARGLYGEGSKSIGNVFQISNQVTLGLSEEETLKKLKVILLKVIARELEIE